MYACVRAGGGGGAREGRRRAVSQGRAESCPVQGVGPVEPIGRGGGKRGRGGRNGGAGSTRPSGQAASGIIQALGLFAFGALLKPDL